MFAVFKKELRSYFINAIGYVYVAAFLCASTVICGLTTWHAMSYSTSSYFSALIYAFVILIPLLTMKLFAEEKKLKTEQLLMTAPISIPQMVLGKFFASLTLFVGTVLVSCVNFIPLYSLATRERAQAEYAIEHIGPVTAEIVTCVLGLILLGAAFIAIGLFVSSLTENQLAAAVVTVCIIFAMIMLDVVNTYIDTYAIRAALSFACVLSRFNNFTYGMLDFSSILYYLSITGVFLFLTTRVYDKRRWG
jgi:ABC-2 type transport system permease protein